jgi:competence protein ComEA
MTAGKLGKWWTLITILLVAIIAIGGIVAWAKYSPDQPVEISLSPSQELRYEICISGAVINPGLYPVGDDESIEDIIQAAGGTTLNADLSRFNLYIPEGGEAEQPQKINLNHAEAWLLQALPGIGETLAQRIIDYRQQNGPFSNIKELVKVEGIGATTYEEIKHLVTVAD